MIKIQSDAQFFNVKDTLCCGQVFRFFPYKSGYLLISGDKCCYVYNTDNSAVIECESGNENYFYRYFDLSTDYSEIYVAATKSGYDILKKSAEYGKGVRILRQDADETLLSFIISQNNNITRIKGCIEKVCDALGEKMHFGETQYRAFPSMPALYGKQPEFYKQLSLGYRAEYIPAVAKMIDNGYTVEAEKLSTAELKKSLVSIKGVGEKVANCSMLFGFCRRECFPVDTWLEKVYRQDFYGTLTDRRKITAWFEKEFYPYGGYFQQYLFYAKREGAFQTY